MSPELAVALHGLGLVNVSLASELWSGRGGFNI